MTAGLPEARASTSTPKICCEWAGMKLIWKRGSSSLLWANTNKRCPSRGVALISLAKEISNRGMAGLGEFRLSAAFAATHKDKVNTSKRGGFFKIGGSLWAKGKYV